MWFAAINEPNKISISNKHKYLKFIILLSVLLHAEGPVSPISCCDAADDKWQNWAWEAAEVKGVKEFFN